MAETETPQTPNEEAPPNVRLNKDGSPDKRYTAGGTRAKDKRGFRRDRKPRTPGVFDERALYDALYNGAMGVGTGAVMVSVPHGHAMHPATMDALDTRAQKFAASWVAAARQDERVAKYLTTLLSGGVWIAALGNTVAFLFLVGVVTGKVQVIPPPALFFVPEIQDFVEVPTPSKVEENGAKSPGDGQEDGS